MHRIKKTKLAVIVVIIIILLIGVFFMKGNISKQVIEAINNGHSEKAVEIIEKSTTAQLNRPSVGRMINRLMMFADAGNETYPIIAASSKGDIKAVEALIEKGVDLDVKNYELGYTALIAALDTIQAKQVKYEVAHVLINNGANVDLVDGTGKRAIDYALLKDEQVMNDNALNDTRINVIISIIKNSKDYKDSLKFEELLKELQMKDELEVIKALTE